MFLDDSHADSSFEATIGSSNVDCQDTPTAQGLGDYEVVVDLPNAARDSDLSRPPTHCVSQSPKAGAQDGNGSSGACNTKLASAAQNEQLCRICTCGEDDDEPLQSPCTCSGSLQYVHESCLFDWLVHKNGGQGELTQDEKNRAIADGVCELCGTHYSMRKLYKGVSAGKEDSIPLLTLLCSLAVWKSIVISAVVGPALACLWMLRVHHVIHLLPFEAYLRLLRMSRYCKMMFGLPFDDLGLVFAPLFSNLKTPLSSRLVQAYTLLIEKNYSWRLQAGYETTQRVWSYPMFGFSIPIFALTSQHCYATLMGMLIYSLVFLAVRQNRMFRSYLSSNPDYAARIRSLTGYDPLVVAPLAPANSDGSSSSYWTTLVPDFIEQAREVTTCSFFVLLFPSLFSDHNSVLLYYLQLPILIGILCIWLARLLVWVVCVYCFKSHSGVDALFAWTCRPAELILGYICVYVYTVYRINRVIRMCPVQQNPSQSKTEPSLGSAENTDGSFGPSALPSATPPQHDCSQLSKSQRENLGVWVQRTAILRLWAVQALHVLIPVLVCGAMIWDGLHSARFTSITGDNNDYYVERPRVSDATDSQLLEDFVPGGTSEVVRFNSSLYTVLSFISYDANPSALGEVAVYTLVFMWLLRSVLPATPFSFDIDRAYKLSFRHHCLSGLSVALRTFAAVYFVNWFVSIVCLLPTFLALLLTAPDDPSRSSRLSAVTTLLGLATNANLPVFYILRALALLLVCRLYLLGYAPFSKSATAPVASHRPLIENWLRSITGVAVLAIQAILTVRLCPWSTVNTLQIAVLVALPHLFYRVGLRYLSQAFLYGMLTLIYACAVVLELINMFGVVIPLPHWSVVLALNPLGTTCFATALALGCLVYGGDRWPKYSIHHSFAWYEALVAALFPYLLSRALRHDSPYMAYCTLLLGYLTFHAAAWSKKLARSYLLSMRDAYLNARIEKLQLTDYVGHQSTSQ